jgi:hypothetical protein
MAKWAIVTAAAVVIAFGAAAGTAEAHPDRAAATVDGWYRHYLGRCADPSGLQTWAGALRCGRPPEAVLAGILASDEYYHRNGCCPTGLVRGLYQDHLGRCPSAGEARQWQCELERCGREQMVIRFLAAARRERGGF